MFCHKCGNKNTEGAGFCHKCGTKLAAVNAASQANNEPMSNLVAAPKTPVSQATVAPIQSATTVATGSVDVSNLLSRLPAPEDADYRRSWVLSSQTHGGKENCVKCNSGDVVPIALILELKSNNDKYPPDEYLLCKSCGHHFKRAGDEYKVGLMEFAILGILGLLVIPLGIWIHGNGHFMGMVAILAGIVCLALSAKYLRKALKAIARMSVTPQNPSTAKKIPRKLIAFGGAAIALVIILIAVFASNQGGGNSLVGTWENDYNPQYHYTFHADGRGTRGISPFVESFTWRVESRNTVVMTFPTTVERWNFTIRGNSLTFTGEGMYFPFTRIASAVAPPIPETGVAAERPADIGGINAETFAFIKDGMSIDQVRELIGVEPTGESTSEMLGVVTTGITWTDGWQTTITVIFTDGYVTSSQILSLGDGTADAGVGQGAVGDATIDMSDWRTVTFGIFREDFAVTIPSTWQYERNVGGADLEIYDLDSGLLFVIVSSGFERRETERMLADSIEWDFFQFEDGNMGHIVFQDGIITFDNMGLHLQHHGDMETFLANEALILAIARTLTSAVEQETTDPATNEQESVSLTRLEAELVGTWIVINPFWAWHEEIEEGDIISFDADGLGTHSAFGFGTSLGDFIWHIEMAESWDGPSVRVVPTLFMNFPNRTISFALNEGDTIMQDPFDEGNLGIPLHQDAGAPFYLMPFMP